MLVADLEVVQERVGPAHRCLDVFVQLVQRAVLDLDAPPDRRIVVLERDLELVDPLGGGDRTDALRAFESLGGEISDVPQQVGLHARVGVQQRFPSFGPDRLQLGQRERNRPLVSLIEFQSVGKLRRNIGDDPPLGLGELDRVPLFWLIFTGHSVAAQLLLFDALVLEVPEMALCQRR